MGKLLSLNISIKGNMDDITIYDLDYGAEIESKYHTERLIVHKFDDGEGILYLQYIERPSGRLITEEYTFEQAEQYFAVGQWELYKDEKPNITKRITCWEEGEWYGKKRAGSIIKVYEEGDRITDEDVIKYIGEYDDLLEAKISFYGAERPEEDYTSIHNRASESVRQLLKFYKDSSKEWFLVKWSDSDVEYSFIDKRLFQCE